MGRQLVSGRTGEPLGGTLVAFRLLFCLFEMALLWVHRRDGRSLVDWMMGVWLIRAPPDGRPPRPPGSLGTVDGISVVPPSRSDDGDGSDGEVG